MKILRNILLVVIGVPLVVVIGTLVAARFNDGPLEIIAGGPFSTGTLYTGAEPDWSYVHDMAEVQFQLLDPERSRTTWILEVDGRIFIPCGYMDTTWGRIWKQWPIEAEKDGRILLRVGDTIYERNLERLSQGPLLVPVLAELGRKYAGGPVPSIAVSSGSLWLFEVAPR